MADAGFVNAAPWARAGAFAVATCLVSTFTDYAFIRRVVPEKARYFVMHVLFNTWLSWMVWSDALAVLAAPSDALIGDGGRGGWADSAVVTTAAVVGFHVYHMLCYTGLAAEDWVHHLVSCVFVPAIGIGCPFGKAVALSNLGMCGIPGAVDYALLAGVKIGAVPKLTEKRVNAMLNLLLRWPLMLLCAYVFFLGWHNGTLSRASPRGGVWWIRALMALGVGLHTANAAYYAQKVIGNYHVTCGAERGKPKEKRADPFPVGEEKELAKQAAMNIVAGTDAPDYKKA
jgi:hypothetical protein